MLVKDAQAESHELVVVRLVARSALELFDAGRLGERNPDFRNEHAFQVKADNVHGNSFRTVRSYDAERRQRHAWRSNATIIPAPEACEATR